MILKKNNECIKEIDDFLIISLPDGCIGLMFFGDRRDYLKRNTLHFVMSKTNDRNNALIRKENTLISCGFAGQINQFETRNFK